MQITGRETQEGVLIMTTINAANADRKEWVEPEIVELDVRETFALPRLGADAGGNPFPDCQRS
jgi:hypothetical protein